MGGCSVSARGALCSEASSPEHSLGEVTVPAQHIHGIRTTSTSFPMDRYALSSASIKPERSRHLSAGYAGMTAGGAWDWSAEIYYRTIRNVYDYRDGMSMFSRIDITNIIAGDDE